MTRRLTRAEIILLHGVLSLYRDDLLMIEPGPEEAEEAEFCGMLLLKLEVMRDESPGLGGTVKFSQALEAMDEGKKVRRAVWRTNHPKWSGSWMEKVEISTPGRDPIPQLICCYPDGRWFTYAGSQWDALTDDWEIADEAPAPY